MTSSLLPRTVRKVLQISSSPGAAATLTAGHAHDWGWYRSLAALVASKTNGLFLWLEGEPAPLYPGLALAWALSGLSADSKLLSASPPDLVWTQPVKGALDDDLRLAFHYQEAETFLSDIAHHRFDFLFCRGSLSKNSQDLLQTMLNPGAILIAQHRQNAALLKPDLSVCNLLPISLSERGTVADENSEPQSLAVHIKTAAPLRRKGGRTGKADRPSLRSLKTLA